MSRTTSLRRRFLFSFAGLLGGLAVLSLVLTVGILFLSYRTTVEERIHEVGHRFAEALREAEEALLFRTRILADLGRIEALGLEARVLREVQVHTLQWLKRDGLHVVGAGNPEFWERRGEHARLLERAFAGIPSVALEVAEGEPPRLLGASPREHDRGVAEVILAALPLDRQTMERLARRAGGEIALLDEQGHLLATSLAVPGGQRHLGAAGGTPGAGGHTVINGRAYDFRTFRLEVGHRPYGTYAVLWPVGDLRALTWRLALWQAGGGCVGFALFFLLYRKVVATTSDDVEALTGWARGFTPEAPEPPPALSRTDEVGVLSQAFSGLAGHLAEVLDEVEVKNRELADANLLLEDKVRDKTREVEQQKRLFETVLSGMAQAVFLVDRERVIAYANPAAVRGFGPMTGRPCESLWGAPGPCCSPEPVVAEVRRGPHTYLVSFTPLEGQEGGVMVAQDVTERRDLERQLLQSQKLESIGRLAAGVAHDFNNILGAIVPCVEVLRRRVAEPRARTYLDTIDSATGRASEVVKQLLAFSRAGGARRVPLELNGAVEGALRLLRPSLKQVNLEWHPGEGLPLVAADETQLQQVVLNLALNAVDAMAGKGSLRISTQAVPGGRGALLTVADTGPGIPGDLAGKVFDPFFTTKEVGKGSGLGLSIVYGIVENHGGRIRLVSPTEGGARFEIELPASPPAEAGAPPAPRPTLLLVDDDPLLLQSLASGLEDLGFAVRTARTAEDALATLEDGAAAGEPGAALLDVRMPG
ncbi:MAG: ATP-binding protein, partial [Thermodesulfobacteriota bacterium]